MSLAFTPKPATDATILSFDTDLVNGLRSQNRDVGEDHPNLLDHILEFATRAEQKMAEQRARIDELEQLARTDELTGLINRRGLEGALERLLASATRHGEVGVICYIDIDDFKNVNDTHGHTIGDEALKLVSSTLSDGIRAEDLAARVGGDEFVVILKGASISDGLNKARKLQSDLGEIELDTAHGLVPVSVSMGIQPYDGDTQLTEILHRADCAMYAQKRAKKTPLVAIETDN